jgi:Flp pilus assembly protein protease CpaA
LANIRRVVPVADDVALGMLSRWPGSGRLIAVLLVPAVFLACSRGHSRLVSQLAVTAGVAMVGLYAQYLVSVQGTGAGAAVYLQGHLGSTAHRVLLYPSVLCSLAVPLLAGASLRRRPGAPAPLDPPAPHTYRTIRPVPR